MKEYELIGERNIKDDSGEVLHLSYYLTKKQKDPEDRLPLYGIHIVKYTKTENGIQQEKETAESISYNEGLVKNIMNQLMEHTVTPMTMLEVIDDLVSCELYNKAIYMKIV